MVDSINQDVVYALAASPDFTQDNRCFAARQSGLWRSDDGGIQWRLVGDLPGIAAPYACSAVAVSPNFQVDATVFIGVPGAVMLSNDGGYSWTAVALASPPPFVSALAVSPNYASDGMVFAITLEDGVFRSQDRGVTWKAWNFGLFDLSILSIAVSPAFSHDKTVYAGAETGIFYSTNTGRAWRETGFPTDFAPVLSLAMSPQFVRDGIIFASTESSGLFYSNDKGQTWLCVLEGESINTILLAPTVTDKVEVLAISNNTLWLSRDGGQSWSDRNPDNMFSAGFTAVAPYDFAPESPLLLGLADGQILRL